MPNRMPPDLKRDLRLLRTLPDKPDKPDTADSTGHAPDRNRTNTGQDRTGPDNESFSNCANLYGLVRRFAEESPGIFTTSDIDRELGINTRQGKKNRSDCLSDLVCKGIIERDLSRRGVFRKKNSTLVEMDILGAKAEELPVELPFGLSKFVEINEKEVILIMGESNSGKTAVIFNMIWSCLKVLKSEGMLLEKDDSNCGVKKLSPPTPPHIKTNPTYPNNHTTNNHTTLKSKDHANYMYGIRYFSSEMGPTGVRKKLQAFGKEYPIEEWIKYVVSVERNRDFQDVVDPRGLNFIDYLEVFNGEYFKLSSEITSIFSQLETGIAVIALQKRSGTDIGRGGEATLEKPRLAIALSENKEKGFATAKIIKAKHYREFNPVGMEIDFIVRRKGTRLIEVSQWGYAKDHKVRRDLNNYHNWDQE